jgi:hypothetical protein
MGRTMKPRVMYLDIDDVLLVWSPNHRGYAAPKAKEFIHWAKEHFEVRWLTMWAPSGKLSQKGAEELAYRFGYTMKLEEFLEIENPNAFFAGAKTYGIDFDDDRPFVWLDDKCTPMERHVLQEHGKFGNYYKTNVTSNFMHLQATWNKLAKRFDLPKPTYPYSKELTLPNPILTNKEILDTFRQGRLINHDEYRPPVLAWS